MAKNGQKRQRKAELAEGKGLGRASTDDPLGPQERARVGQTVTTPLSFLKGGTRGGRPHGLSQMEGKGENEQWRVFLKGGARGG